jgi:hypothetical protein
LIGCEYSGTMRDAFRALGHDAMSCDLLPTESPGPHHQGDVRDVLHDGWDLAIFHPDCTYLTNAGARWLWQTTPGKDPTKLVGPARWAAMVEAASFFRELLTAPIPRIAVENPIMHGHAKRIVGQRQDQVVQPWMFGHTERKATGLWLKGLPPLLPTHDVRAETYALPYAQTAKVHHASPGADRWKLRSLTCTGLAAAAAAQWGGFAAEERAA